MFRRVFRPVATLAALFMSVAATLPGAAQAQVVEWRGSAYLHSFTSACSVNGWNGSPLFNVRFRPSGIGPNGNASRLSFFDDFYSFGFYLDAARFDRNWRRVYAGAVGSSPWFWDDEPEIRVTAQTPSNTALSATTPVVRMVGQIRNFEEIAGCTVTFDATMLRRR